MKRRIYPAVTAVAAAVLALGVATAAAATGSSTVLKCQINLTTAAPPGQQAVTIPPLAGTEYGPAHCGSFGAGIQADSFKVPDSGDKLGSYTQYFSTATIHGKFNLSPLTGAAPSSTAFESQDWAGTITVTGGTGNYASMVGKKGTLKCSSPDSVHLHCVEKISVTVG